MSRLSRDRIMRATLEPFVLLLSWLRVRIVTFHRHQIAYAGIIHFHESGRAYRFHATLRSHLPLLLVGAIRLRFPVHLVDWKRIELYWRLPGLFPYQPCVSP